MMLVEVALTPQVFDAAENGDVSAWTDCLDELAHCFFPRNAASPVVASNLYDGGWLEQVKQLLGNSTDQAVRGKVQRLYQLLKDIVVPRPLVNDWPGDESGWVDEAAASHRAEPMGRILLTDGLHGRYCPAGAPCHPLHDVKKETFWDSIQNTHSGVPMVIGQQVALLRPICLHSKYLALKLPHARGTDDDETPFAGAVLKSALSRPEGFPPVEAELHIDGGSLDGEPLNNVIHNVRSVLADYVPTGQKVLLCVWPSFLDRKLVAGLVTKSDGQDMRAPRWGVKFQHVARPRDSRPPTGWFLVSRHEMADASKEMDPANPEIKQKKVLQF